MAFQLACRHARVYVAARSQARVEQAIVNMRESAPKGISLDLHLLLVDLQSLHSVKAAADEFMKRESRLDLLINNAGVSLPCSSLSHILVEIEFSTVSPGFGGVHAACRRIFRNNALPLD